MSAPFSIDLSASTYEAGGKVTGTVIFDQPFAQLEKASGVRLELKMLVTGSGNSETVSVFDGMIHQGPVSAPTRISFEVELPAHGPCTFDGRYVKIAWQARVSVDVAWAIDPKQVEHFRVVPRGSSGPRARAL